MKKDEFIRRYGEDKYQEYLEKQKLLTKKWRENNKEKARKYGREYYFRLKMLAMMGATKDDLIREDTFKIGEK